LLGVQNVQNGGDIQDGRQKKCAITNANMRPLRLDEILVWGPLLLDKIYVRKFEGPSFWIFFWTTEETSYFLKSEGLPFGKIWT
jgi:hypothetical protein